METFGLYFVSKPNIVYICARFMKDEHQLKNLLVSSRNMFMKYGLKSLTMDEIAKELGMSKKTIYQFVESKADLIRLTLIDYLNEEKDALERILHDAGNAIEQLIHMIEYFLQILQGFNSSALHDMEKYYPESWAVLLDYRNNFMLKHVRDNLAHGMEQGFYRKGLNADVVSKLYVFGFTTLHDQQVFPAKDYVFFDIYREFLRYHLSGIATPKGLQYMEQLNLFKV